MKMIKRSTLLGITIGLAALLLIYTFLRTFTPLKLDESQERIAMNCLMFCALGIFVMNRQIVAQEKKEAEAKEAAEKAKMAEVIEESAEQDESEESYLP
ncbi:MAG: hypothetical protein LBV20_02420 [Treponema sp.]|nr:hypothetical protein [Treponema sp.]